MTSGLVITLKDLGTMEIVQISFNINQLHDCLTESIIEIVRVTFQLSYFNQVTVNILVDH